MSYRFRELLENPGYIPPELQGVGTSAQHISLYFMPEVPEVDERSSLTIAGHAGRVPGTHLTEEQRERLKKLREPHGLKDQEKITTSWGHSYSRWEKAADNIESKSQFQEGTPGWFWAKINYPWAGAYPAVLVWEYDFGPAHGKRWHPKQIAVWEDKLKQRFRSNQNVFVFGPPNRFKEKPSENIWHRKLQIWSFDPEGPMKARDQRTGCLRGHQRFIKRTWWPNEKTPALNEESEG